MGRLTSMERKLRENCHQTEKMTADPDQDFFDLTLELRSQEERLAALQIQRDELLIGLKGLLESLKNQATRLVQLEGRLSEVLDGNGRQKMGEPVSSNITPQEYNEPCRRGQTNRGGKRRRILEGHIQPRVQESSQIQTDTDHETKPDQLHAARQSKHSKAQMPESYLQIQVQKENPKTHPDPSQPQVQIQTWAQTQPYPSQHQHQLTLPSINTTHQALSQLQGQTDPQVQQPSHSHSHPEETPHLQDPEQHSRMLPRVPNHYTPEDIQNRTSPEALRPYKPSVSGWDEGEEDKRHTMIHNFLQIPLKHKIPAQPIPKRDATSK